MKLSAYLLISGVIFAQVRHHVISFALIACAAIITGCSTCPPCVPEHEIVDNTSPVYFCPAPPELPPLILPPYPVLPEDAGPVQVKAWYLEMATVTRARIDILQERVETIDTMLEAYRGPPQ